MKITRSILLLASISAAFLFSSCISIIKTADEPKMPVTFSSAKAAQTFYEKTYVSESHGDAMTSVNTTLPIVLPSYRKNEGAQLQFNNAVRAADTDGDRHITTAEAKAYAEEDPDSE